VAFRVRLTVFWFSPGEKKMPGSTLRTRGWEAGVLLAWSVVGEIRVTPLGGETRLIPTSIGLLAPESLTATVPTW
jgi:hypothetical protein